MISYKFRGKQYKTGEWLVGDLIHFRHNVMILPLDADWFDFVPRKDNPFRLPSDKFVVDPETVGQFTGLFDKNGKEIYEGDIVRYRPNNKVYQVVFKDGIFWGEGENGCGCAAHFFPACEIVGNVFDNPGLIEKGVEL